MPPNPNRYGILSTKLLHSNLSVIHYSVFFQMCRAHGIGFDIKVSVPLCHHHYHRALFGNSGQGVGKICLSSLCTQAYIQKTVFHDPCQLMNVKIWASFSSLVGKTSLLGRSEPVDTASTCSKCKVHHSHCPTTKFKICPQNIQNSVIKSEVTHRTIPKSSHRKLWGKTSWWCPNVAKPWQPLVVPYLVRELTVELLDSNWLRVTSHTASLKWRAIWDTTKVSLSIDFTALTWIIA